MPRDVRLIRSPISVAGMWLTTASAVVFLVVFLADLFGLHTNPYLGILFFLLLPAAFVLGLVLIPLGAWVERRRRAAGKKPTEVHWPQIDLNSPRQRQVAVGIFALTMANVVIVSLAAYRGIEYMDSVEFCGEVCHQVMQPEYVAHADGPHAKVQCVACHIGPGATGFTQAKLSGARRVVALAFDSYSRPIPAPVHDLSSAREVCERCHWPGKFHGDKVRQIREYAEDEANTESLTELVVHVGGGGGRGRAPSGIHWHTSMGNQIEYVATDDKRQVIPYVKFTDAQGNVREYTTKGVTPEMLAAGERRRMDCIDCHNRPSHTMRPSAERAVNELLASGQLPSSLPYIRRESARVLKASYPSQDAAVEAIERELRDFYRTQYQELYAARQPDIDQAVQATQGMYRRNVFPQMNVQFGTYPNNIGHVDTPGCFRCHDEEHETGDGKTIAQDCESCHTIK